MRKKLLVIFILLYLLLLPHGVFAAKKRVRPVIKTATPALSSVKLRSDRLAAMVTFYNLNNYQSISYSLTYTANGIEQGVQGSVSPFGQNTTTRELLFGTCSKNVCTYHKNIKNMKLTITGQAANGKIIVKRYKINV